LYHAGGDFLADTLHKLAIQIQGDIDKSFGGSIKEMNGQLKQLDDEVKNIADSKTKPGALSEMYLKLNKEAGDAHKELAELNGQLKLADGYSKQSAAAAGAEKKLRDARAEVERLEEAQKNSGTKEFAAELKNAKKEATAAERAYDKETKTLSAMSDKLKASEIDTENLGKEQARLAGEIDKAKEKTDALGASLARLVKAKYYFKELREHAKQLGSDLAWVGKTWLKMGAAVGAGGFALFKIADSVAAAGDAAAKSSAKLHMTAEAFQELKYAADLSGVKDFDATMVKFNANAAKLAKDDKGAKRLAEYGINAKQLAKLKPDVAVMYLADKLNGISDPARRARAELDLFGKSGAEIR
jgi:myosin heavy subunit